MDSSYRSVMKPVDGDPLDYHLSPVRSLDQIRANLIEDFMREATRQMIFAIQETDMTRRAKFDARGSELIDAARNARWLDADGGVILCGGNVYSIEEIKPKVQGYCSEGDRCVCNGDTERVRQGCGNWVKL
jgi:hypothetical protein